MNDPAGWELSQSPRQPRRRGSDRHGVNPRLPGSLRHTFLVRYRTTEDGIAFFVPSLPGVRGKTTGRKGLAAAARNRIALELDVPDTAFDVELQLVPR
jgi:hypothetical protein